MLGSSDGELRGGIDYYLEANAFRRCAGAHRINQSGYDSWEVKATSATFCASFKASSASFLSVISRAIFDRSRSAAKKAAYSPRF